MPVSASALIENGELLIVSSTMSAAAVDELIASNENRSRGKSIASGLALIILLIAAVTYGGAASGKVADVNSVVNASVVIFIVAFLASMTCVALSEY
ncbi:MAG: hypothetical protein AAF449_01680 [Myxococcota bacterium]